MKLYTLYAIRYTLIMFLICNLIGCDAFVRKFTRKSKKDNLPVEEMVIEPEEYKPPKMTKEEAYRQYFLYWKSWHDELVNSLLSGASQKKDLDCANEAMKNLQGLRKALRPAAQKRLDVYINQFNALINKISDDTYNTNASMNRLEAERIRRGIMREFTYSRIKDSLA